MTIPVCVGLTSPYRTSRMIDDDKRYSVYTHKYAIFYEEMLEKR